MSNQLASKSHAALPVALHLVEQVVQGGLVPGARLLRRPGLRDARLGQQLLVEPEHLRVAVDRQAVEP